MEHETRQDMIKYLNLSGRVTEIGVFRGDFAEDLLKLCPNIEKLTLVDIWSPCVIGSGDQDGNNFQNYSGLDNYQVVLSRFYTNHRVRIIRDLSSEYFKDTKEESLDVVYIDGDHSYEGCSKDLEDSYKVVKKGGWIMGHDYKFTSKCKENYDFGVGKAVDEFCSKYNLKIDHFGMDGCVSYAIKKI